SQMRVLMYKLDHQFVPLSQLIEGVNASLDQVIIRSLHPNPDIRPASVSEFLSGMRGADCRVTLLMPKPVPKVSAAPAPWKSKPSASPGELEAPGIPPAGEERRRGKRHRVQLDATVSLLTVPSRDSWPAQIIDISTEGLCLRIQRRFELGTLLNIALPEERTGQPGPYVVRICWIETRPCQNWLLGGHFVCTLETDDLNRLLL